MARRRTPKRTRGPTRPLNVRLEEAKAKIEMAKARIKLRETNEELMRLRQAVRPVVRRIRATPTQRTRRT